MISFVLFGHRMMSKPLIPLLTIEDHEIISEHFGQGLQLSHSGQ